MMNKCYGNSSVVEADGMKDFLWISGSYYVKAVELILKAVVYSWKDYLIFRQLSREK